MRWHKVNEFLNDLIIMVGLPLSGKSTLAKKISEHMPNITVVCPDTIRLALHGNQFIGAAEPFVWAVAQIMARTLLIQGNTVIIDATNTSSDRRKMWVQMAKEFKKPLIIYHIQVSADVCRERNQKLSRLDEKIINRMETQLTFSPPVTLEGQIFSGKDVEQFLEQLDYGDCDECEL